MQSPQLDSLFAKRFQDEVASQIPHLNPRSNSIEKATPLLDITSIIAEFTNAYVDMAKLPGDVRIFGKFDSKIFGGSVKVRSAVQIVGDAISTGVLTPDKTIFEATSGNFGIALALLRRLNLRVIALVSRKLHPGVVDRLNSEGVNLIDLDVDICPAPGFAGDADRALVEGISLSMRQQLKDSGLDPVVFDKVRSEAEELLGRQDVIELAKLLAKAYGGFCTEQYDNELNVYAHESVTGPEIAQQLGESGESLGDYQVVCSFGTGGTATGISRHMMKTFGTKGVHVAFPQEDQDVAGIRSKGKAVGLRFYHPEEYASEIVVDFEKAKLLMDFMNQRDLDVGESGGLSIIAATQLIQAGKGNKFVVVIADGASKYIKTNGTARELTLHEALTAEPSFGAVVWTHSAVVPNKKGLTAIAAALGVDEKILRVAKARELQTLQIGESVPDVFRVEGPEKRLLLVCMAGGTSLAVAEMLSRKGVQASSLSGGIMGMPLTEGMPPFEFLQQARE